MVDHVDNPRQVISTIDPADALVDIVCNNPDIHDIVAGSRTHALFSTTSADYRQTDSMQLSQSRFTAASTAFVTTLAFMLTIACGAVNASESVLLKPFQSEYAVNYSGFRAARTVSLERDGEEYILRSTTRLKGAARLTGYGPIYEVSRFTLHHGVIQPSLYSIGEDKANPKRDIRIEFDWASGASSGYAKGEDRSFALETDMQDPLSFELMARLMLAQGKLDFVLKVHEGHRVRSYHFIEQEEETLNVASRAISATRYFIDRNSSRELYYWFSNNPEQIPLQIRQRHGQKTKGTVTLTKSTLLD